MYADLNGLRLWFDRHPGAGDPIVLIHPATGSSDVWKYQVEAFAGEHQVVVYDKRGTGRSAQGATVTGSGSHFDDLLALLDHLGLSSVHLVGAGRGGGDALAFAVRHPDRLISLIITNSYGGVTDASYVERTERLWTPAIRGLPAEQRELSPSYRETCPEGVAEWLRIHAEANYRPGSNRHNDTLTFADVSKLPMPVLVVGGDADLLSPPSLIETLAASIPGSRLEIIARSAHASPWEQPAAWNAVVSQFLRSTTSGGLGR